MQFLFQVIVNTIFHNVGQKQLWIFFHYSCVRNWSLVFPSYHKNRRDKHRQAQIFFHRSNNRFPLRSSGIFSNFSCFFFNFVDTYNLTWAFHGFRWANISTRWIYWHYVFYQRIHHQFWFTIARLESRIHNDFSIFRRYQNSLSENWNLLEVKQSNFAKMGLVWNNICHISILWIDFEGIMLKRNTEQLNFWQLNKNKIKGNPNLKSPQRLEKTLTQTTQSETLTFLSFFSLLSLL